MFISFFSKEDQLSAAALELTKDKIIYNPSYFFSIDYSNGVVPCDKGVCLDVIIRAYRRLGFDLQKEVHLNMKNNFNLYTKIWELKRTDKNIEQR